MSERRTWQKYFHMKIRNEYCRYREHMLRKPKAEIFARAYNIEKMGSIYNKLRKMADCMTVQSMKYLCSISNLLFLIYEEWLSCEDDCEEQLGLCVEREVFRRCRENGIILYHIKCRRELS